MYRRKDTYMSEKNFLFRRPEHSYGTRFRLRIGERVPMIVEENSEDGSPINSPTKDNPPNSPVYLGQGGSELSSPIALAGIGGSGPSSPIISQQTAIFLGAEVRQSIVTLLGKKPRGVTLNDL